MGRKNQIEGQINFFDMLVSQEISSEQKENAAEEGLGEVVVSKEQIHYAPGCFPECSSCWCATCEHSTVGGSIPRLLGERELPCPSCELCVKDGAADVCVIGSAEEGCRFRAEKEGITE